jgi:hypothetical protein
MGRRRASSLLATAALAALLAGCGSSSNTTGSSAAPAASTPAAPSAPAGTGSTSSTFTTATPAAPGGALAVTACKQAVAAQTNLSAAEKSKLDSLCSKAGSGHEAEIKKAARAICEEVVAKSIPAGATREAADKGCQHT